MLSPVCAGCTSIIKMHDGFDSMKTLRFTITLMGCLIICSVATSAQRRGAQTSRVAPSSGQPAANQSAITEQDFAALASQATAAREADKIEEAITLYRKAVAAKPAWAEGWWYLGTLYYDLNNFSDAAPAFKHAAEIENKAGSPWAMLGLCEFQLLRYDDAYAHIQKGRELGIGDNQELERVMRYHEGLLFMVKGEFEKAQQRLGSLSYQGVTSEELIIALGLSVLRMGMLPKQVDINYRDHEVVRRAGLAEHFNQQKNTSDATREYDLLVKDFPKFPNVQYAYGRFLLATRDTEGALAAFQREVQNTPSHALARILIAYIRLQNKEPDQGVSFAEEAVKLHPQLPLSHYVLGRLLFDMGQNARAIEELEVAQRLRADEPKVYFALARAYAKANRKADAEKARETFTRLSQKADGTNGDTLPNDNQNGEKPQQP
jgi:tetratricopeptide (TPR) repeat protein